MEQQFKKAGRKPKAPEDRVINKPVYLTAAEWELVESKYGSPTKAMKETALKQAQEGSIKKETIKQPKSNGVKESQFLQNRRKSKQAVK